MRQRGSFVHVLPVLVAILGATHIYIRTSNYGPNVTGDTLVYISVAENLAAGNGFLDYNQLTFHSWAPLFPLLLAVLIPLGIDPVDAGSFINIIGFGILLWISCNWLSRYLKNPVLIVISPIAILLSYPLTSVSSFLLTDTLFIIFTLTALFKLSLFLQSSDPSRSFLAWAASFTALAVATRYLGITVILTGIIIVMIHPGFLTLRSKLRYTTFYTTISSLPLLVWMYRNYISIGYPTGIETSSGSTFMDRLNAIYDVLRQWVWLDDSQNTFQIWTIISVILALCGLFFFRESSRAKSYFSSNLESLPKTVANWKITIPFSLFFIVYLVTILISTSTAAAVGGIGQPINSRYMVHIYIPALLVIFVWLDRLLGQTGRLTVIRWAVICFISLGLFSSINISLQKDIEETSEFLADNSKVILWGYSSDSEIMKYLRESPINGQIYSNENGAIYWLAVSQISAPSDPKYVLYIPEYTDDSDCLVWFKSLAYSSHTAYLVYFHDNRLMSCPIPEFTPELLPYLNDITQTSEADIYRITSSSTLAFHVNINAKTVTYTKRPCSLADTDTLTQFYLNIVPVDENYLSDPSHQFNSIKFNFADHGSMSRNECIMKIGLPHYDISEIYTGQFASQLAHANTIWETKIMPPTYGATRDEGVSATATTVPEAPSGLSAIGGDGWITLSWNDPNDSSITNYQFREQPSYDRDWWCWNSIQGGQTTTFRTEGLPQGTAFRIQVRAQNAAGAGPSSEVLVSTTAVSSPVPIPAAPAGLSGTPGDKSITLSWENPSDNSIIEYQTREHVSSLIPAHNDADNDWRCWRRRGNLPDAALSIDGLTNDWLYRIQLRALNAAGIGPISQVAATPTSAPPSP